MERNSRLDLEAMTEGEEEREGGGRREGRVFECVHVTLRCAWVCEISMKDTLF